MKSGDAQFQSHQFQARLRLGTAMLVVTMCMGSLSACTTVKSGWQSTKDAVGGIFSRDDKAAPPDQTAEADGTEKPAEAPAAPAAPMTGGLFMGSGSAASAFQTSQGGLSAAPAQPAAPAADEKKAEEEKPAPKKAAAKPPKKAPEAPKEEKKEEPKVDTAKADTKPVVDTGRATEGLLADKTKADYTEQGGRREPVTVRPLNENAQTAEASAPPRPAAAPVEQVARLQGQLDAPTQAAPAPARESAPAATAKPAPTAADLANRLNAPAPTPGPGIPDTPPAAAPVTQASIPAPTPVAPSAPAAPVQALIPANPTSPPPSYPSQTYPSQAYPAQPNSIAGYGDDTLVVDSSGTRGGRNVVPQVASAGRGSFDPGNSSVSSEVGTVLFAPGSANLSAQAKAILADAARLRTQVDGAIRVVGRGNQAAARAAAVSKELRRLGVPASRLYDGGADSTVLGDAADIYLDY